MNFRDEKFLLAYGANLKKLRAQRNITQEELAYQSGISLSQIARMETGRINPTVCSLLAISRTLRISASHLLDF
jgi:transcriptional regulator with XRE-family HTH domain